MQPSAEPIYTWNLSNGDTIGVQRIATAEVIAGVVAQAQDPVLQIGSRAEVLDRSATWRSRFAGRRFVGLDIMPGPNVDIVADITEPAAAIRSRAGVNGFGLIVCHHVLEHVRRPWVAAQTLSELLAPGGRIFVSVPWVQGYHEFPDDFWRMSFAGIRALFPDLTFPVEYYTGTHEAFGYQILRNGKVEHSPVTSRIERNLFQFVLDQIPAQRMFEDRPGEKIQMSRGYMPIMLVNMIGVKAG
jgi:SAM-dependent methyltransferase